MREGRPDFIELGTQNPGWLQKPSKCDRSDALLQSLASRHTSAQPQSAPAGISSAHAHSFSTPGTVPRTISSSPALLPVGGSPGAEGCCGGSWAAPLPEGGWLLAAARGQRAPGCCAQSRTQAAAAPSPSLLCGPQSWSHSEHRNLSGTF